MYSKDKIINKVVKNLIASGDGVLKHRNRHCRVEHLSTKLCITVPRTPSDHRAVQNWLHQIKRLGVKPTLA